MILPIALGLARYFTTRYRIRADRVELKRGLLSTHILSTPLDRVRTVDLTASPIHRVLGLTTVRIGTGTAAKLGEDGLDLDGLPADARPRAARPAADLDRAPAPPAEDGARRRRPPAGERVVARFEPGWLRYAPFTSAGLVLVAGVIGVGSQVLDGLGLFDDLDGEEIDQTVTGLGALVVAPRRSSSWSPSWPRPSRSSATSSPTATSRSATPPPTAPGTYAAGCSPPARPASTTTGCAGSRSASRGGCGW